MTEKLWLSILPEIILVLLALGLLVTNLVFECSKQWLRRLLCLALPLAVASVWLTLGLDPISDQLGLLLADSLSRASVCLIGLGLWWVVFVWQDSADKDDAPGLETMVLICLHGVGLMAMCSSGHWTSLMVSLELVYLPLYALVAIRRTDTQALEASVKYLLFGGAATATLMFAVSLLYAGVGSLRLSEIAQWLQMVVEGGSLPGLLAVSPSLAWWCLLSSSVLIFVALAFKLGLFPFHAWVPDVYQGVPWSVVALVGVLPKWALLVVWIRVFNEALIALVTYWLTPVICVGVLSIVFGNLAALSQTNIKRLLGYSAVAQMGYVLLGLSLVNPVGLGSAVFFVWMTMLISLMVLLTGSLIRLDGQELSTIDQLKAVLMGSNTLGIALSVGLVSLMGLPPMAGFFAKLNLMYALVQDNQLRLAVFSMLMSVLGAGYAIRLLARLFDIDHASSQVKVATSGSHLMVVGLGGLACLVVLIGFYPEPLIAWSQQLTSN